MRLLLDTHALLWMLAGDHRLGSEARQRVTDTANEVWVSVASIWEIAVKFRVGKLRADVVEVLGALGPSGLRLLDLRPLHLTALAMLPLFDDHRDPFDHLLIAQAAAESLIFVSEDVHVSRYGIPSIACSNAGPG